MNENVLHLEGYDTAVRPTGYTIGDPGVKVVVGHAGGGSHGVFLQVYDESPRNQGDDLGPLDEGIFIYLTVPGMDNLIDALKDLRKKLKRAL